ARAREVKAILEALNPGALVLPASRGQVPLASVLDTGRFDYDEAASSAGWIRELQGEHTPETEEYGITSFTYRSPRPFDAERLWALFHDDDIWRGVLRSKGFFWVAADHRVAYEWGQAGRVSSVEPMGMWWAAVPRERWPFPEDQRPDRGPDWHPRFGDRVQQLVFIGQCMDEAEIRARLDACLLDDSFAAEDSEVWAARPNPFPPLQMGEASE
ncbi:MAG: GTP-binding protein, partial [Nannocystaceae bacterium]